MEIIIYLCAVLLTSLSIAVFLLIRKIRAELKKNRNLTALLNASDCYSVLWSTDLKKIQANPTLNEFLGRLGKTADADFVSLLFSDSGENTTGTELMVNALSKSGRKTDFAMPDGSVKHIMWKSEIAARGNAYTTIASTGTDFTEQETVRAQLKEATREKDFVRENYGAAAKSAGIGVITLTPRTDGYELAISEHCNEILGIPSAKTLDYCELLGCMSADEQSDFGNIVRSILSGTSESETRRFTFNTDRKRLFLLRFSGTNGGDENIRRVNIVLSAVPDESENAAAQDDIHGELPNRKTFLAECNEYLKQNDLPNETAMLSIYISRFQKISTLFGMDTADKLLDIYTDGIEKCAGNVCIVGKMSTDNFALLIPAKNRDTIERFLKELQIYIENSCNNDALPAVFKEQAIFTAGACFYDGSDDAAALYNKANMTLFTDSVVSNSICRYFDSTIEERIYNRDFIEQEIHKAIKNNEFELYYQPKISFQTKEILGAEALIRWNHPDNGLVTPTSFIPIAEEVGLITQIDEWGLSEACRQNKLWQSKGYKPIRVSVNMLQAQLYQTDVIASIRGALEHTGLDPQYLEVELTETMAIQDIEHTVKILERIHEMGVSISMDDFGTGYSSLSSLKILPINLLKIDKSLIDDIETNDAARSIVKAIVDLGKAMNLEVLAEGVETKEQFELLGDLSCDIAQGYYYGKPLPAAELERLFLARTPEVAESV